MIVTPEAIASVCTTLGETYELGLDTETTGLDHLDLPFSVIIDDGRETFYFDERVVPNLWSNPSFLKLFNQPHYWIYQNAKFDMRMLSRRGIYPTGVQHDIAVQARIQKNDYYGAKAYSLAEQGKRIGDDKFDTVKKYIADNNLYEIRKDFFGVEEKQPRFDWVSLEVIAPYAKQDAKLTRKLKIHYDSLMDVEDQRVMAMEAALTPVVFKMEQLGVRLDTKYTLEAYYHELGNLNSLRDTFADLTGVTYTNSAKSIQKVLSVQLPLTAKGNPSLTDDDIEDIIVDDKASDKDKTLVGLVRSIRHFDKRISTYYVSFLNKKSKADTIHCTMWQAGTRTGRFSSSDPNL